MANISNHWHQRLSVLALFISLVIISWLAFTPKTDLVLPSIGDKFKHFAAFGYLAYLLDSSFPSVRFGLAKILALLGYGVFIELVQSFLPNRSASGLDVLADMGGIIGYWLFIPLWQRLPIINWRWQLQTQKM
ncbi:VanZ family protein [Endozoicomonas sp. SM1973]|uniref:VanZ family protein n=1 Tax=Spartinivicinus marinus TaxID=2994442 RepID=A0A853HVL5_9GAMM|nr:VanZ family protein [Spartinivicinus marinus]MCX4025807.1 VanZ family protein [Spartinivicinus marinus]NYZ65800.1 VanZ family protein [Spartinivicinus marinus]